MSSEASYVLLITRVGSDLMVQDPNLIIGSNLPVQYFADLLVLHLSDLMNNKFASWCSASVRRGQKLLRVTLATKATIVIEVMARLLVVILPWT